MKFISVEFETFVADFYKNKAQSATDRGMDWQLSLVSFRNLLRTKTCPYTGVALTVPKLSQPRHSDLTIDRIDSSKGYIPGNVMAISRAANNFKSIFENPQYPLDMQTATIALARMNKRVSRTRVRNEIQK
ncbi:hypothetical protein [Pseudomonas sp. P8_250]|uniref:hypothetical protein n=1 Tax=Pseudomonas sp. P8_250 TaxID=3043446 RepID=UPI002A364B45|nr:hypothetical protein [Pseudomonas sp. P8_250]MDX9668662.1 hypothetical protein [Pseudomonas sp. P8_250]